MLRDANDAPVTALGIPVTPRAATLMQSVLSAHRAFVDAYNAGNHAGLTLRITDDGVLLPRPTEAPPNEATADAQAKAAAAYVEAATLLESLLADITDSAAAQAEDRMKDQPKTAGEALHMLITAHSMYEASSHEWAYWSEQALSLEDQLGRVRRQCAREIQAKHMNLPSVLQADPKPISDTALDKQAGDHPDYVSHREHLLDARVKRDDALATMNVHKERVRTRREVFRALMLQFSVQEHSIEPPDKFRQPRD